MIHSIQYHMKMKTKLYRHRGTAILETAVGLCVLIPVLMLLMDVISLVVGQTINDDLAKSAARAASLCSTQSAGLSAANGYLDTTPYRAGSTLVSNVIINEGQFVWDTTTDPSNPKVTVGTQITVNLPVAVPMGGPASQIMGATASEPILGIAAIPPPAAAGS